MEKNTEIQWNRLLERFTAHLRLEKSLSPASIEAYRRDVSRFLQYILPAYPDIKPWDVTLQLLELFFKEMNKNVISIRTQARMISGLRGFFGFLQMEKIIPDNPATLLETPRLGRKLPETLSVEEIDLIENQIDLSRPDGHRNRALIEVMYSCGLRVSEVINLRISNIFREEGFVRILGKGNKERMVPINKKAMNEIDLYLYDRNQLNIHPDYTDILFLNRFGKKLSRVYIFKMIKEQVQKAGIKKTVSPHTFRHSFATHLMEGGADLRAIQEMLGHESIQTTEIYTHLDKEYLRSMILEYHPRS
ncbi:MAG TPA: tyrosine recombinase XerD [Bacteroidetes bacterium]|nr:tyrosine recombinase XerD [Bacteroidota bacterium]